MNNSKQGGARRRQSGAALLLLMLVVIVGAAAVLVTELNGSGGRQVQLAGTQRALADAKKALLNFAATYPDTHPGSPQQLPCPDLDGSGVTLDGEAHSANCGAAGVSMLGRLPWKTLGIAPLKDGASECLWYVVSGEFKSAGSATSAMINPDANGQLQLYQSETGSLLEGISPAERPVAMIIAPGGATGSQTRQAIVQPDQQCSGDFSPAAFLEVDAGTGVSNATLSGTVGIEQFVRAAGAAADLNDRILSISRREMADLIYGRQDFATRMQALTERLARCVAAYGVSNPAGANDLRLPWPASLALTDYRDDAQYDDVAGGVLSGRLADSVDDSNSITGNSMSRIVTACDSGVVPGWGPESVALWQQWKDHFFYYVAASFSPAGTIPSSCSDCIAVNGAGQYAAVVLFANRRLAAQTRNAPPIDTDTRDAIGNYLESVNESSHPYTVGSVDLRSQTADAAFNDVLYCIDSSLSVAAC